MATAPFFTILDRVDSTNNYAMGKVRAGLAAHGMAWFAREQTGGKGQRGKSWESTPGQNIALSLVLEPWQLMAADQFYLSALVSLACRDFLERYAGEETAIKWPNDIYWRDRKAGGILIENVFQGTVWKYAVVGIGININQVYFNTGLKNPVSLKQISGKDYDPILLAEELFALLIERTRSLDIAGFAQTLADYNTRLYARNREVRLLKDDQVFVTMVRGVNAEGQLLTKDTEERRFDFGEVEWLL